MSGEVPSPLIRPFPSLASDCGTVLAENGWVVVEDFFSEAFCGSVREEIARAQADRAFRPASVGKSAHPGSRELHPEIRGDGTLWFEPDALMPAQSELWALLEDMRAEFNRSLYLGLWDFEGHYAVYAPGAFYRKHIDRFKNDSKRTVSAVFFFNSEWKEIDGGALVLDLPEGSRKILPVSGTAVFFLSDRIPHEVLETRRERLSFAGWFRTR